MKNFTNIYNLETYRYIEFIIRRSKLLNVVMFNVYGKRIIKNIIKMIRLMTQYEFSPFYVKDIYSNTRINYERISYEYKFEYCFFNRLPNEGLTVFLHIIPLIDNIRCFDKVMLIEINFYSNIIMIDNDIINHVDYWTSSERKKKIINKIRSLVYLDDVHRFISHKEENLSNTFLFNVKIHVNNSVDNRRMHETFCTNKTLYSNYGITNFNLVNSVFIVENSKFLRSEFINSMFETSFNIDYSNGNCEEIYMFGSFFNVNMLVFSKAWELLTKDSSKNCRFKCYHPLIDKKHIIRLIKTIKTFKTKTQKEK